MSSATPDPRRWKALWIIAAAQFLVIMDTSIIGVALPDIQRELHFSQADLSWVFNAYVVAFGGLLLLGGKLSDVYGPRRLFTAGFGLLAAGSLVAGLADTAAVEIAGRAIQGAAAALIAPAALTLLMVLFSHDARELTKAMGLYGAAAPAGGTAGVFLGGVLTDGIDWRWTLLINVPLALAVLAATPRLLPVGPSRRGRIDVAGALTATAGLAATVFAIVRANEVGWGSSETLLVLGGGLLALAAFVAIQARRRDPLMALGVFRVPNLASANVVMALLGAAWIPMWFTANLWLQQVLGAGAFEAGAALLPMTILIMAVMVGVVARLIGRYGVKVPMVAGLAILTAGIALFATVPSDGGGYASTFLPASLIAALGMSLTFIPAMMAAIGAAPPEQGGLASGIVNTTYQVGSALGLAAITALSLAFGADQAGSPAELTDGFHAAFLGAAGIALVAGLIALATVRVPRAASPADRQAPRMRTVNGRFARHYAEMVVVMFLGMAILGPPAGWALGAAGSSWSELRDAPALMLALMTFTMTAPMVAWMRWRGHSPRANAEMAMAMIVPALAAIALHGAGAIEDVGALLLVEHALMLAAMFAVMLLRPDEYSGTHHHTQPATA